MSQLGLTLLETMLVLGVASLVIVLALNRYAAIKEDAELQDIENKVDGLFMAMRDYYKAQCRGQYNTSGALVPGTLNPATGSLPVEPLKISLETDLITPAYLRGWNPVNRFLSLPSEPNNNDVYVLQYNPYKPTPQAVTVNSCIQYPTTSVGDVAGRACQNVSATTSNQNIVVLIWASQVAIKLPGTLEEANILRTRLGADCVSVLDSGGNYVVPCSSSPSLAGAPFYLVWQRFPSNATKYATSPYWQTLPTVNQFNLQYTHDQMLELQGSGSSPSYYLCGG